MEGGLWSASNMAKRDGGGGGAAGSTNYFLAIPYAFRST